MTTAARDPRQLVESVLEGRTTPEGDPGVFDDDVLYLGVRQLERDDRDWLVARLEDNRYHAERRAELLTHASDGLRVRTSLGRRLTRRSAAPSNRRSREEPLFFECRLSLASGDVETPGRLLWCVRIAARLRTVAVTVFDATSREAGLRVREPWTSLEHARSLEQLAAWLGICERQLRVGGEQDPEYDLWGSADLGVRLLGPQGLLFGTLSLQMNPTFCGEDATRVESFLFPVLEVAGFDPHYPLVTANLQSVLIYCSRCGAEVASYLPSDHRGERHYFCAECAEVVVAPAQDNSVPVCPRCGLAPPSGRPHCGGCGAHVA